MKIQITKEQETYKFILLNKIDEDYYKPVKTKSAFNGSYIQYESRGDRKDSDKNLPTK